MRRKILLVVSQGGELRWIYSASSLLKDMQSLPGTEESANESSEDSEVFEEWRGGNERCQYISVFYFRVLCDGCLQTQSVPHFFRLIGNFAALALKFSVPSSHSCLHFSPSRRYILRLFDVITPCACPCLHSAFSPKSPNLR